MPVIRRLNEKGLTLIELLAVIVILAIIVGIAIPSIQSVINNQRDKAIMSDIAQMVEASKIQMSDNNCLDEICTYSPIVNEINFTTNKFTIGTVNFTNGFTPELIKITANVNPSVFKGRNQSSYRNLFNEPDGFTERDLIDALND